MARRTGPFALSFNGSNLRPTNGSWNSPESPELKFKYEDPQATEYELDTTAKTSYERTFVHCALMKRFKQIP